MDLVALAQFAGGVFALVGGAWLLITGGTRVAAVLGVPSVVVGLTVVAFGTSAPELFVSFLGAVQGSTGLVLGNVVGSNVANIGLILALAAILRPVKVERGLIRREMPLVVGASLVFLALVWWDGLLGRIDAALLCAGFGFFMWWTWRNRKRGSVLPPAPTVAIDPTHRLREFSLGGAQVVGGIAGLAVGGHFIVVSAQTIALGLGVSETLIGLTMVAVGTSLPELATTVIAAIKNQDDLAVGNIIGSNLFNLLGVAGPVGLLQPLAFEGLPAGRTWTDMTPDRIQLLSMLMLTILVAGLITARQGTVGRGRGVLLLACYTAIMLLWTNG